MRRLAYALTAAMASLPAGSPADLVLLSGGDRFTGTIQKLEGGTLFFLSKHSEAPLRIDWSDVAQLTSESELLVTMRDGTKHYGKLAGVEGLAFVSAFEPRSADCEVSPGWLGRAWNNSSISSEFDQSYSGLTGYNQLSSHSEFEYAGDRWDGNLVTHYEHYLSGESRSTYQAYGRFVAKRYLRGEHLFLFTYSFLGRQTTADGGGGQIRQYGGGAGWTFRRHQSDQVSLFAGLVRSIGNGHIYPAEALRADSHLDDILYVSSVSWDRTVKNKITTSLRLYYYKPVAVAGHHAMATDASVKVPLFGPTYFTVRAYDTPELRQYRLFSTKNLQVSSGIGVEF